MAGIILGFMALAGVEMFSLYITAQYLSIINTISLIMLTFLIGIVLGRSYEEEWWGKLQWHLRSREPASDEVLNGAVMVMGSKLLMTPGTLTDLIGLIIVFPKTRFIAKSIARKLLKNRISEGKSYFFFQD